MQSPLIKHFKKILSDESLMREASKEAESIVTRAMKNVPDVNIGVSINSEYYAVMGWDDFDKYCNLNSSIWSCVSDQAKTVGMTESDRLRILSRTLMLRVMELEAIQIEHIKRFGC